MKRKIIHFIFNLGRGGAETMMVRVIRELNEYEHVVVTLFPLDHFTDELKCDKQICFHLKSLFGLPSAILKLRKVIKEEKPDIVHTHLFWPTIIARIAVPKRIPLITTIHAFIVSSVEYKHWYIRFLDKLTYRFRKSIIIAVAKGAWKEYFSFLRLKPWKAYVLYTFVDMNRFQPGNTSLKPVSDELMVISVGALRTQKNYQYLLHAFERLKGQPVKLHIYGAGDMEKELQARINETGVNVILKGEVRNIEKVIPQYDLYIMSSIFEGFSLSVLEAMAMGMPLLLSDIPSFREQCGDTATYFSLEKTDDLVQKLLKFSTKNREELKSMGEKGRIRAINNFTLPQHMEGLRMIYRNAVSDSGNELTHTFAEKEFQY